MTDSFAFESEQSWAEQVVKLGELMMSSQRDGDMHAISLNGEMDVANAGDVEHELLRVEDSDAGVILVDLSGLTFMDHTAIGLLHSANTRLRARGDEGRLLLLRPPEHVHRALRSADTDEQLSFAD